MALSSAIAIARVPVRDSEEIGQSQTDATTGDSRARGTDLLDDAIDKARLNPFGKPSEGPLTAEPSVPSRALFEALYEHLGRWTGRYGSRQAQSEVIHSWKQTGGEGAFWLVRRVAKERNLEALDGASIALEAMGAVAAPHIIASLAASASTVGSDAEMALKLFRILEWFPVEDMSSLAPTLEMIMERFVSHSTNAELREAIYRCMPLLPNREDVRARALVTETDPDLRDLLQHQDR